jgi:hypothetical protein
MMKTLNYILALLACWGQVNADEAPRIAGMPNLDDYHQVISVLRSHYADTGSLNDQTLSAAAIEGLLGKLGPGTKLLTASEAASLGATESAVASQKKYAPEIAYVRVGTISSGSTKTVEEALLKLDNPKLSGWIIDLRFTTGNDYHEAATLAGLFIEKDKTLLTLKKNNGEVFQKFDNAQEPRFARTPLIVLVNGNTQGAAEAVAAIFQQYKRGLLIGHSTAGESFGLADFPFKDGHILRIPTLRVLVAQGVDLWRKPVEPELCVKIDPAEEKGIVLGTSPRPKRPAPTNEGGIRSEAELISLFNGSGDTTPKATQEVKEQTDDLVLARALDVLNAWNTFHPSSHPAALAP